MYTKFLIAVSLFFVMTSAAHAQTYYPAVGTVNTGAVVGSGPEVPLDRSGISGVLCENIPSTGAATFSSTNSDMAWKIYAPLVGFAPQFCPVTALLNQDVLQLANGAALVIQTGTPNLYKVDVSSVPNRTKYNAHYAPSFWQALSEQSIPAGTTALKLVGIYTITPEIVTGDGLIVAAQQADPNAWMQTKEADWYQRVDNKSMQEDIVIGLRPTDKINFEPSALGAIALGTLCPIADSVTSVIWEASFYLDNEKTWITVFSWPASSMTLSVCPHLSPYVYMASRAAIQRINPQTLLVIKLESERILMNYELGQVVAYPNLLPGTQAELVAGTTSVVATGGMIVYFMRLGGGGGAMVVWAVQ